MPAGFVHFSLGEESQRPTDDAGVEVRNEFLQFLLVPEQLRSRSSPFPQGADNTVCRGCHREEEVRCDQQFPQHASTSTGDPYLQSWDRRMRRTLPRPGRASVWDIQKLRTYCRSYCWLCSPPGGVGRGGVGGGERVSPHRYTGCTHSDTSTNPLMSHLCQWDFSLQRRGSLVVLRRQSFTVATPTGHTQCVDFNES